MRKHTTEAAPAAGVRLDTGLPDRHREDLARLLNTLLADEFLLYAKTRSYHWSVTGPQFAELHKLFEAQYEALNGVIDAVAERVRALGHRPLGSLAEFAAAARLKETPEARPAARGMVSDLLRDYEALIRCLRADARTALKLGDDATNNYLVGLLESHEKTAWMLRATLEP